MKKTTIHPVRNLTESNLPFQSETASATASSSSSSNAEAAVALSLSQTSHYLKNNDNYLIITHKNPDGDTCGSAAALCVVLRRMGKSAYILPNETATQRYLPYFEPYTPKQDISELFSDQCTVVTVDVADTSLLSLGAEPYAKIVDLCIDHHPSNRSYSKYLLLDSDAAATGEIILDIIRDLGMELDRELALPLYLAISTDTGCFRFSNTTSRTFRAAAELVETGIDFVDINTEFFDTKSKARLLLEQKVIEGIKYYDKTNTALAFITKNLISETGAKEEDIENFSSLLRSIEGVEIGAVFREIGENKWKISLRTGSGASASLICSALGGGGHERAAGCTYEGSLQNAVNAVIEAIEAEYL